MSPGTAYPVDSMQTVSPVPLRRGPGRPRHGVCPPASEKVMEALDKSPVPLSPLELQAKAHLPRRTLFFALHCLHTLKAVTVGLSLRDTRRRKYMLPAQYRNGQWRPCLKNGQCLDAPSPGR